MGKLIAIFVSFKKCFIAYSLARTCSPCIENQQVSGTGCKPAPAKFSKL
ncbi:MAG: hypothetical protein LBN95_12170 [Prevotellaceae bacterium]|nr:hypothetical protein [Prevotellaceae bacterium]